MEADLPRHQRSIRPILTALRATAYGGAGDPATGEQPIAPAPFVTISRQAGAGGHSLAHLLCLRMNRIWPRADHPWTSWGAELVEKVAHDAGLSKEIVESFVESRRTWLETLLDDIANTVTGHVNPDELTVYRRVATTIRALAQAGRVVIVGRGGMCITRDMPGGVHVRLVAPVAHRVAATVAHFRVSLSRAHHYVQRMDEDREYFYARYWPDVKLVPENFTLTLNMAALNVEQACDAVIAVLSDPPLCALVPGRAIPAGQAAAPAEAMGEPVSS
jgi:hypothetical protein